MKKVIFFAVFAKEGGGTEERTGLAQLEPTSERHEILTAFFDWMQDRKKEIGQCIIINCNLIE
jgi:hypothetical protein